MTAIGPHLVAGRKRIRRDACGLLIVCAGIVVAGCGGSADSRVSPTGATHVAASGSDWPMFGFSAARADSGPTSTSITFGNVARLQRQRVQLGGTADSSAIYLHAVRVGD